MDNNNDPEVDRRVAMADEAIRETLSPAEPWIMRIQSLLVWEKPIQSVALLICIHVLFWLLTVFSVRIYFLVPAALVVIMFLHTWKRKIWPEIRVPPPIPEDHDGWTEVHPRLLSVPEISRRLAHIWISMQAFIEEWLEFRRDHSFLNWLLCSGFFICLWTIGCYISGIMLTYILTMTLLLWPCMLYHSILQKLYMKCEPVFMKLDYCLQIRGKWPFRSKRTPRPTDGPSSPSDASNNQAEIETDSDIDEFVPSYDPETSAALARAITDSEDETGSSTQAVSPQMSKEPSVNDNSDEDLIPTAWREADLAPKLDEMPSFDTVLDNTDDELLDDIDMTQLQRKKGGRVVMRKKESKKKVGILEQMLLDQLKGAIVGQEQESRDGQMSFVPSHFRDSESEEEETLTKDLDEAPLHYTAGASSSGLDDSDAVAQLKSLFTPPEYSTKQRSATSDDEPSLVSAMSQSLSSAVQAAYSGISTIGGNILPSRLAATQEEATREVAMEPKEMAATGGATAAEGSRDSSPGSEIEFLDEEFEFLDDYDDASEGSQRK